MGFFDGWLGSRTADFDSGSAATNAIELTKRHHQVSLTVIRSCHENGTKIRDGGSGESA